MQAERIFRRDGSRATICDSKSVAGTQIADCTASVLAAQNLAEIGFLSKTAQEVAGYDFPIELAWALWASVRYSLAGPNSTDKEDESSPLRMTFGLLVSDSTVKRVKQAAEKRLGTVWLGCIH